MIAKQRIITNFAAQMRNDNMLVIDLHDIKSKIETLNFELNDDFFADKSQLEINGGKVNITVKVSQTTFEKYCLGIEAQGFVIVNCHRCCGEMQQKVDFKNEVSVQLGDKDEDDGDIITVDRNVGKLELDWIAFEQIALSLPLHHTHKEGECDKDMEKAIKKHSKNNETNKEDPRWSALKKININN